MGIGIDAEDIERWRNRRHLERIFTPTELERAMRRVDPAPTLAGLWCAREAAYKALNKAHPDIGFRSLSVRHDDAGRPHLCIRDHEELAARVELSISHTATVATAVALLV